MAPPPTDSPQDGVALVPEARLELARPCGQQILSLEDAVIGIPRDRSLRLNLFNKINFITMTGSDLPSYPDDTIIRLRGDLLVTRGRADMLTERKIRDAKPEPKARIIWDRQVVGLGLKVFPTGRKAFVLSYRTGGRKRLATIARAGECGLAEARELAGRELIRIRGGEADPLTRRTDRDSRPTVDQGLDRLFGEWAPERIRIGKNKESTIREYRLQADKYLRPRSAPSQSRT